MLASRYSLREVVSLAQHQEGRYLDPLWTCLLQAGRERYPVQRSVCQTSQLRDDLPWKYGGRGEGGVIPPQEYGDLAAWLRGYG